MKITRTSPVTGKLNTLEIPVSEEQLTDWMLGTLIQVAMPNVSAGDREFIRTGMLSEEFDKLFPKEEDEDELEERKAFDFEIAKIEFSVKEEKYNFEVVTNLSSFGLKLKDALDNWLVRTEVFEIENFCDYVKSKDPQIICVSKEFYDSLPEDVD